jgi:Flp pilus assembly protein TadD
MHDTRRIEDARTDAGPAAIGNCLARHGRAGRLGQPGRQPFDRRLLARRAREAATGREDNADDEAATPAQQRSQAYLLLAQAAEQRRDFKDAEMWLAKVDASQALLVQSRRASLLAQQGQLEQARALLRQLPERSPEEVRAKLLAEAQLLRDQKQWAPAYSVLTDANQRFRDDTDLLYEQAMMAEKLDRFQEMEQLLRRVIALRPDHPAAFNALGYTLADRNERLVEAKQLIERALEMTPGDPFLIDSLGWVEYRLGNREEAMRLLRQAYQSAWISSAVVRDIRSQMFAKLQTLSTGWFHRHQQGDVLTRLFNDVMILEQGLTATLRDGIFQSLSLVVSSFDRDQLALCARVRASVVSRPLSAG